MRVKTYALRRLYVIELQVRWKLDVTKSWGARDMFVVPGTSLYQVMKIEEVVTSNFKLVRHIANFVMSGFVISRLDCIT